MVRVADSISAGFELGSKRFGHLVGPSIVAFLLALVYVVYTEASRILAAAGSAPAFLTGWWSLLVYLIVGAVSSIVCVWLVSSAFGVVRGRDAGFSWSKVGWVYLFTLIVGVVAFAASFLVTLGGALAVLSASHAGLALALVVGIVVFVVAVALLLAYFYFDLRLAFLGEVVIVDSGINTFAAFGRSWRLSRRHFWELVLLAIVLGALNVVGFIVLLVGLVYTIPVSIVMIVHYYDGLLAESAPKRARVARVTRTTAAAKPSVASEPSVAKKPSVARAKKPASTKKPSAAKKKAKK